MLIFKNIIMIKSKAYLEWLKKKFFKNSFINFSRFPAIVGIGGWKFIDGVVRNDTQWPVDNGYWEWCSKLANEFLDWIRKKKGNLWA